MTLSNWWILCAVSLASLSRIGSCRGTRAHGAPPELFIFSELCALKDDPGPCKAIKDRFFFSVDTGRCELFEYGGCGGNANNFETLDECEAMCVVSDDKNPCHLPEAPGPCRGLVTRYFFDTKTQQCKRFFYGGCFGNANNFKSLDTCRAKCLNPVKPTMATEVHKQPPMEVGFVEPTVLTGELTLSEPLVQLNDSRQETNGMSPSGICFSPVDRGTCQDAQKRFAYNPETKRCQMFHYSGCGGNKNNFFNRRHCIQKCIKSKRGPRKGMIRIRKKNLDSIVNRSV
ncbi:tissue factor pathway inhibitor a [Xenentodon cancila]